MLVLESRLFKTFGNLRHPTACTDGSSMRQIGRTKEKSTLGKDSIVVGFSLFAMFFGAGNLIFPPTLGQLSGDLWAWGLVGFLLVDAVLSCLGVFVVSRLGGPRGAFDGTLGKIGGTILTTVAILCLCVVFAMPRTAATTFELSVAPYLGEDANSFLVPFSILFFVIVYLLTCRKSRVVDIIGKFFTPTLLVGVLVLIVAGVVAPIGEIQPPQTDYVFQEGIRSGYQTMDVLGVAAFSIIILDSAVVKSYTDPGRSSALLARASIGAVVMLGLVYGGLTYLGATSVSLGTGMSQVGLLVAIVESVLGDAGKILLSAIVALACVTTAVALVSSAADFFSRLFKNKISYQALLIIDCVIGALICDIGLDNIIRFADPVLGVVYPPFITVVVLLIFRKQIKLREVYQGAAIGALVGGIVVELAVTDVATIVPLELLPLSSMGFGWIVFALMGALVGMVVGLTRRRRSCS